MLNYFRELYKKYSMDQEHIKESSVRYNKAFDLVSRNEVKNL